MALLQLPYGGSGGGIFLLSKSHNLQQSLQQPSTLHLCAHMLLLCGSTEVGTTTQAWMQI